MKLNARLKKQKKYLLTSTFTILFIKLFLILSAKKHTNICHNIIFKNCLCHSRFHLIINAVDNMYITLANLNILLLYFKVL